MTWTTCKACGKQCDLPEPSETDNPLVAGKCIDCIKQMQDTHEEKQEWFT